MKRFIFLAILFSVIFSSCEVADNARQVAQKAQSAMAERAATIVPIPEVSYFQEKRTIAKWAERWDKPSIVTYVYLISFGNIIGYYVADGKPASTRSYLMPEEAYTKLYSTNGSELSATYEVISAPDIDGTYGDNNPGIRFFTAEGIAVEWAGAGASYIYSDSPLPLNVPKLNVSR